jgi:Uma2 family endonuclease
MIRLHNLEQGDRLTREEFERRYQAMPHLKKAELIRGVVYMPSPVRLDAHGEPHLDLATWLGTYKAATPGLRGGDNTTARLDLSSEPQPDLLLLIDPACGGQAQIGPEGYVESAPEFVVEVAASSASYDLHDKLDAYLQNRVREYVVYRVLEREVDWFILEEGQYHALSTDADGLFKSTIFPGLWLDPAALVRGDLAQVLSVVGLGIRSAEHAAFVQQLAAARQR